MDIKINNLEFGYSSSKVLDDITLDLSEPQLVAILGPNGVGKSTLMHCINRILVPDSGTVFINGKNTEDMGIRDIAKTVGYVPCFSTDTFSMSVVDTVLLGRHPHNRWRVSDEDLNMVYDILNLLNIDDLALRSFNELSAGQHQKVMLARGLAQEPQIMMLDEPTANLDVRHQLEVMKILKALVKQKGMLVIMVCHDINMSAKYADKIIMMSEGKVFAAGEPKDVINRESLMSVYHVEADIVDDHGSPHVILQDNNIELKM